MYSQNLKCYSALGKTAISRAAQVDQRCVVKSVRQASRIQEFLHIPNVRTTDLARHTIQGRLKSSSRLRVILVAEEFKTASFVPSLGKPVVASRALLDFSDADFEEASETNVGGKAVQLKRLC